MNKELEAIKIKIEEAYKQLWHEREYAYDSKICSKGKGWAEAIQHYDNIGKNLLEVKRILDDLLTKYETIKNAEPSEALECLKHIKKYYIPDPCSAKTYDCLETIKEALLKAQKEHKTLEIIKKNAYNSGICITYLKSNSRYSQMKNYEHYCMTIRECDRVSEDEFNLLKEVLENE